MKFKDETMFQNVIQTGNLKKKQQPVNLLETLPSISSQHNKGALIPSDSVKKSYGDSEKLQKALKVILESVFDLSVLHCCRNMVVQYLRLQA